MSDPIEDKGQAEQKGPDSLSIRTGQQDEKSEVKEGDSIAPGVADDRDDLEAISEYKWHDFESQYTVALQKSIVVEREQWGNQCEFLMSCIASAVGLGNIWRFPIIAGQNGGGAFLIPYLVVLSVIGRPIYLMELGLGQFTSSGPIKIWELAPAFRGVGYGAAIASFCVSSFYVVILGWSITYLVYSFFPILPWNKVGPAEFFEYVHLGLPNTTWNKTDFWNEKGLDGFPMPYLAASLVAAWLLVWLAMVFGVSGSGKVAYFTALFPYVVLFILLIRGATLEGAGEGIKFFFTPNWADLLKAQTWFQAIGQCFFSLGIIFGACFTFASFNQFHHQLGRDILIISIMDTFTSVLAGASLFCLLGNLSHNLKKAAKKAGIKSLTGTDVRDLASKPGAGMAFITFPTVLEHLGMYPLPQIFSFLFFFMIIVLAVGSANGLLGTCIVVVCDRFPNLKRQYVVTGTCILCFLFGLIYICPTGSVVIDIVDKHGSAMPVYFLSICEVIGIIWVYGLKNLCNDMDFMLGPQRFWLYWQVCWICLPVILAIIIISYFVTFEKEKTWPGAATGSGWALTAICWTVIPVIGFIAIQTRKSSSFKKRIMASLYPSRKWGPKEPAIREAWRRWKKTQPTEFKLTGLILRTMKLRKSDIDYSDPRNYWTTETESPYQTQSLLYYQTGLNAEKISPTVFDVKAKPSKAIDAAAVVTASSPAPK